MLPKKGMGLLNIFNAITFTCSLYAIVCLVSTLLIFTVFILLVVCVLFEIVCFVKLKVLVRYPFSPEITESLENSVLETVICDSKIQSDWVDIDIEIFPGTVRSFKVHSLIVKSHVESKVAVKPVLLWLHGTGGTAAISFAKSGIMGRLATDYDIYAVDLPGFGRSVAPQELKLASERQLTKAIVAVLRKYIIEKDLSSVHIAAHSFGGFLAVHLAHE